MHSYDRNEKSLIRDCPILLVSSYTSLSVVITDRNEVVAKVIFLHLSVILFTGGSDSVHAGIPPPAKETPLQAHTQGGNWGGSGPGPHPRGKLRGIRFRPIPKGEIEGGDQIQAHTQGGKLRGIRSRPTPKGEIEGDQIEPPPRSRLRHTVNERPVRILLECILVEKDVYIRSDHETN